MSLRTLITALFVTALLVTACGKKGDEAGPEGGAAAAEKADLSSPKAAFESFAKKMDSTRKQFDAELQTIFKVEESETFAPVITEGMSAFLKEREKKRFSRSSESEEGILTFDKEEKGEGEDVVVMAKQTNARTTTKRDPKSGEETTEKKEEHRTHKVILTKVGEEWRVKEWHEKCPSCEGGGKCPECDGTGTTKPKECMACEGSGKSNSGDKCYGCEGTGKRKPGECHRCKETEGKCGRCKGEGWKREDDFDEGGFFTEETLTVEKYLDLSAPVNTAKSFVNLKKLQEAKAVETLRKLTAILKEMVETYFVQEAVDRLKKGLAKSAEEFKRKQEGGKTEFGEAAVEGDSAVVNVIETSVSRKGKEYKNEMALKLVKKGADWKIDDRGGACYGCKGSGKCGGCEGSGTTKPRECYGCKGSGKDKNGKQCWSCKGSGKTKPGECFRCKADKGVCSQCKGGKYNWERAQKQ
ncbi:MAG: hypothetical protein ACYTFG_07695 [Planctomycetota bacterium]|jgi:hypothetical protein